MLKKIYFSDGDKSLKRALVLTGGGARAAYQVGVLKAISEIWNKPENPFHIITGISAGAINGTFLAAGADDFKGSVGKLWELWAELQPDSIYRTKTTRMGNMVACKSSQSAKQFPH